MRNEKNVRVEIQTRYWCVCMMRVQKIIWEYKRNEKSPFLPYFDYNGKNSDEATIHEKLSQQQNVARKIAAWKNRESENTQFFSYACRSATNSELERRQGFSQLLSAVFYCNSLFSVPLRHKTIFFRFFHTRSLSAKKYFVSCGVFFIIFLRKTEKLNRPRKWTLRS